MVFKKKKVIMLLPKPGPTNTDPGLPLTLISVSSLIDRKKFDVRLYSATSKYDYIERIKRNVPSSLCFCVSALTGYQIKSAIEAIKEVKKINPKIPIIWGGWHASILPEQTLVSEYADVVVVGQGERTIADLVERLAAKKSLHGLQGTFFKDRDGKIVKNPPRPFEDRNNFPPLQFDAVNLDDFVVKRAGIQSVSYISSQGCPFNCAFCADPLVYKRRWSGLKAERVIADIEFLANNCNIKEILIADENFFVDEKRVQEICKGLIKKKFGIKWGRVNGRTKQLANMNPETWELMQKSNCADILVGAESGLQEGLDLINKMASVEDTKRLIELARRYGIEIAPSLMIGLPYKSYKSAKTESDRRKIAERELNAILDLLDDCYPSKDYFEILLFVFTPYPGNPLFEKSLELGFKPPQNLEEWSYFDIVEQNLPWLTKDIYSKAQQLMDFIFPYACDQYIQRHSSRFKPVHWLFHQTALFRWKHRFFAFPIEHKILKLFRHIRNALR